MKHPHLRSERRFARQVWRDRRRRILFTWRHEQNDQRHHIKNTGWLHSGKQCSACGNRCADAMIRRHERHKQVKRLRGALLR